MRYLLEPSSRVGSKEGQDVRLKTGVREKESFHQGVSRVSLLKEKVSDCSKYKGYAFTEVISLLLLLSNLWPIPVWPHLDSSGA